MASHTYEAWTDEARRKDEMLRAHAPELAEALAELNAAIPTDSWLVSQSTKDKARAALNKAGWYATK